MYRSTNQNIPSDFSVVIRVSPQSKIIDVLMEVIDNGTDIKDLQRAISCAKYFKNKRSGKSGNSGLYSVGANRGKQSGQVDRLGNTVLEQRSGANGKGIDSSGNKNSTKLNTTKSTDNGSAFF